MRTAVYGLTLAIVLLAAPVTAAVAPEKPSNLVSLISLGDASRCQGAPQFSRRLFSDGTFGDFVIPPEHVLVITAVEIDGQGYTAGRRQLVRILQTPLQLPRLTIYADVDPLGFIGAYQPIAPIVVAAGQALCLEVFNSLTTATVHGFLTKDR